MFKIIGLILILSGAGGFGLSKAVQVCRRSSHLQECYSGLELLKCEMNYSLAPLPQLCRTCAGRCGKTFGQFLILYAEALEQEMSRSGAVRHALSQCPRLTLPSDAQMVLLELFGNLGRYELAGENRLLQMSLNRLGLAAQRCEAEKKPLAKGYAILGICTGLAIAILML